MVGAIFLKLLLGMFRDYPCNKVFAEMYTIDEIVFASFSSSVHVFRKHVKLTYKLKPVSSYPLNCYYLILKRYYHPQYEWLWHLTK